MTTPSILGLAITGSMPTRADTPAVPISSAEQVRSTRAVFDRPQHGKGHWMWQVRPRAARPPAPFVMGVRNAMPADRQVLDGPIRTVKRLFGPDAPRCAAGIGAARRGGNAGAVGEGGRARRLLGLAAPGLEDVA